MAAQPTITNDTDRQAAIDTIKAAKWELYDDDVLKQVAKIAIDSAPLSEQMERFSERLRRTQMDLAALHYDQQPAGLKRLKPRSEFLADMKRATDKGYSLQEALGQEPLARK